MPEDNGQNNPVEQEGLSCEVSRFQRQMCSPGRKAIAFVGKDFPGTEPFIDALSDANERGFFGAMSLGVIAVDSEECDNLAEHEGVEKLPTVNVYENCKKLGSVAPTQDDARKGYTKTIEKLIDLSSED